MGRPGGHDVANGLMTGMLARHRSSFAYGMACITGHSVGSLYQVETTGKDGCATTRCRDVYGSLRRATGRRVCSNSAIRFNFVGGSLKISKPFVKPKTAFSPTGRRGLPAVATIASIIATGIGSRLAPLMGPSLGECTMVTSLVG